MRIMLRETPARFRHDVDRKRPTNVSLGETLVKEAKQLGINVSGACEDGLAAAVKAEKGRRWKEENADAIRAHNEWIEKNGIPLAEHRRF